MPHRCCILIFVVLAGQLTGCVRDSWSYRAVPDVSVRSADRLFSQGPLVLRTEPQDAVGRQTPAAENDSPQKQTVLVASWRRDASYFPRTVGRTLVVTLDGPARPGQYWLTPDNAVLVTYSSYAAPTRERVNLTGSVKIVQVKNREIVADLAVRDASVTDYAPFLDRPYDPVYWQWPFILTGRRAFPITRPDDPALKEPSMNWVLE